MNARQSEMLARDPSRAGPNGDDGAVTQGVGDPVLRALGQAEESYRAVRAAWDQDAAEIRQSREEAERARQACREAEGELHLLRTQLETERRRTAQQHERAQRLAAALKDVHKALFTGNVYELILKACMSLTGATRGVYVTAWGGNQFRARAAVDVDGYPGKPPSAFVRALCEKVIGREESFVAHDRAALAAFPVPDGPGEGFDNCLAAPAILLQQFNGVVILADKPGGFEDEDVEQVMSIGDQAGVALENQRLQRELLEAYFAVVGVMADAIEAKDADTHGHCASVSRMARRTAARLAADDDTLRSVCCYGGLLHDIGKIGVSDGVLNKPGKLLPEEWVLMQSHVRIGRDLLAHVPALDGIADVVLHHHERYDGGGYPDGLAADRISLAARIVCVVDAYSAMVSKRSYKESMTPAQARVELESCKGTHFDPRVVDAFLAVLDEPEEDDDCPDGCGLTPEMRHSGDFQHVIRAGQRDAIGAGGTPAR